jgi:hypothetical protein
MPRTDAGGRLDAAVSDEWCVRQVRVRKGKSHKWMQMDAKREAWDGFAGPALSSRLR